MSDSRAQACRSHAKDAPSRACAAGSAFAPLSFSARQLVDVKTSRASGNCSLDMLAVQRLVAQGRQKGEHALSRCGLACGPAVDRNPIAIIRSGSGRPGEVGLDIAPS